MTEDPKYLTGQLLLAMPGMGDARFEHAVIVMAAHDEEGAIGVGIGHQRIGLTLRDLLGQLDIEFLARDKQALHARGKADGRGRLSADFLGQQIIASAAAQRIYNEVGYK